MGLEWGKGEGRAGQKHCREDGVKTHSQLVEGALFYGNPELETREKDRYCFLRVNINARHSVTSETQSDLG